MALTTSRPNRSARRILAIAIGGFTLLSSMLLLGAESAQGQPTLFPSLKAELVSITFDPNPPQCNKPLTITVTWKNVGDAEWNKENVEPHLGFSNDYENFGSSAVLPNNVGSGETVSIPFTISPVSDPENLTIDATLNHFGKKTFAEDKTHWVPICESFTTAPTVDDVSPDVVPASGGITVTVTGTNLGGAQSVNIGPSLVVTSGITVNSAGTILTFISPTATPSSGNELTVTAPGGTSPASSFNFLTFDLAPGATITSPSSTQFTIGQVVPTAFTCNPGEFGTISTCLDSNGSTSPGALNTGVAGANLAYTVTATSGDGQTGTATLNYTVSAACTTSGTPVAECTVVVPAGITSCRVFDTSAGSTWFLINPNVSTEPFATGAASSNAVTVTVPAGASLIYGAAPGSTIDCP
jgi:hypothetical protein